jgi:predicted transcriptional regulator
MRKELDKENYYLEAMEGMFGEKDRELEKKKETIDMLLQEKAEIVKKMKQRGMSSEEISEITGLTPEEIEKL